MAHPKRKTSKSRKRKRKTGKGLNSPSLTKCPKCNTLKLPHRVCPNCGYYKGREVLKIKVKEKKKK